MPAEPLLRDHVTFRTTGEDVFDPTDAAADLVRHVKATNKDRANPLRVRPHRSHSGAVTVRVYWQGGRFHTVSLKVSPDGRLLASHNGAGGLGLSLMLHEWLAAADRFGDICWRTRDQWKSGEPGAPSPADL